jgi:uncharacterized protein (TIGR03382 family)
MLRALLALCLALTAAPATAHALKCQAQIVRPLDGSTAVPADVIFSLQKDCNIDLGPSLVDAAGNHVDLAGTTDPDWPEALSLKASTPLAQGAFVFSSTGGICPVSSHFTVGPGAAQVIAVTYQVQNGAVDHIDVTLSEPVASVDQIDLVTMERLDAGTLGPFVREGLGKGAPAWGPDAVNLVRLSFQTVGYLPPATGHYRVKVPATLAFASQASLAADFSLDFQPSSDPFWYVNAAPLCSTSDGGCSCSSAGLAPCLVLALVGLGLLRRRR